MPNDLSEDFRSFPKDSEEFGKVPNVSEPFRTVRNDSEARQNHTLTVREVARLFESAGVGRTERSITNWCQPNKTGIARLDAYFDPNDRRYFITPESVEAAIQEELAREKSKVADTAEPVDQVDGNPSRSTGAAARGGLETGALEQEIFDLQIMNKGKDYLIGELRKEREGFAVERQRYMEDLMKFNRRVGELETKLNQIDAPAGSSIDELQSTAV
jgi:hypothetical protein